MEGFDGDELPGLPRALVEPDGGDLEAVIYLQEVCSPVILPLELEAESYGVADPERDR